MGSHNSQWTTNSGQIHMYAWYLVRRKLLSPSVTVHTRGATFELRMAAAMNMWTEVALTG